MFAEYVNTGAAQVRHGSTTTVQHGKDRFARTDQVSPDGIGGLRLADERYGSLIERAVGAAFRYMSPEAGRMDGARPVPGPRDDIP